MTTATPGPAGKTPAPKPADEWELERLREENAKLRDRVHLLERQAGQLENDATLREQRALDRAEDCAEHGALLAHYRHLAHWHFAAAGQQEVARFRFLGALRQLLVDISKEQAERGERIPLAEIAARIEQAIDAQYKIRRKPAGWPPLEAYLHQDCACSQPGHDARPRLRELRDTLGDVLARFTERSGTARPDLGYAALRTGWELEERVERWRTIHAKDIGEDGGDFTREAPPARPVQAALFGTGKGG